MKSIDLNCDMGESVGAAEEGNDAAIMPFISSANIACGFHAGDSMVMSRTIKLALQHGVAIGAHPGYPDKEGFGRRPMNLTAQEVEALVVYQISALAGLCCADQAQMVHVKPHGALYNQAAKDRLLAEAIARAIARFDKNLILIGLAGSELLKAGESAGLRVVAEGFPDRTYATDGSLRPRTMPGAVIEDPAQVAEHGLQLAERGVTGELDGAPAHWKVNTLCIHGDAPRALDNARALRKILTEHEYIVNNN